MLSLKQRLFSVSVLILACFFGMTGWVLNATFETSMAEARKGRLESRLHTLMVAIEIDQDHLTVSRRLPLDYISPISGIYAQVLKNNQLIWKSPSLVKHQMRVTARQDKKQLYELAQLDDHESIVVLAQTIEWESSGQFISLDDINDMEMEASGVKIAEQYQFMVAENTQDYDRQIQNFRQHSWRWLTGAALLLIFTQLIVLRWSLLPLSRVARLLLRVEQGEVEGINENQPAELKGLVTNINTLIRNEREQLKKYRDTLADLAHTFKTPLAIMKGELSQLSKTNSTIFIEQIDRMNTQIEYQLQKAATYGKVTFKKRVELYPIAQKVIKSLKKVYLERALEIKLHCEPQLFVVGNEEDFYELLGNFIDNACKYGQQHMVVTIQNPMVDNQQTLLLIVEDDGNGISEIEKQQILERGRRGQTEMPGHGIGLAIVMDIVNAYHGQLFIENSVLGGAKMKVVISL